MIRAVLAVLLAVALLSASFPVIEDAREDRSATLVESELDVVETAGIDLVSTEQPIELDKSKRAEHGKETTTTGLATASRRSLSVDVPGQTLTEAPVEYVALGGVPAEDRPDERLGSDPGTDHEHHQNPGVLVYRLADSDVQIRHTPVEFRAKNANGAVSPRGEPLVLRGDAELTLSLVELDGDRVVLVRRRA